MHRSSSILAVLAFVSFSLAAGTAAAQPTESGFNMRSARVSWRDLDLSRVEGQHALYARLQAATKSVCGEIGGPELRERRAVERCRDEALALAVRQIDAAAISSLHLAAMALR